MLRIESKHLFNLGGGLYVVCNDTKYAVIDQSFNILYSDLVRKGIMTVGSLRNESAIRVMFKAKVNNPNSLYSKIINTSKFISIVVDNYDIQFTGNYVCRVPPTRYDVPVSVLLKKFTYEKYMLLSQILIQDIIYIILSLSLHLVRSCIESYDIINI